MTLPRLLGAIVATCTLAAATAPSAFAADGSFQPTCRGSAKLGESREDGDIGYKFACSSAIAGYSIVVLNRTVDSFDTEPVVLNPAGDAVPGEDFGCSGEIPGYGIGCGGFASAWNQVNGVVHVNTDPCGPGRPRLVVSVADSKGRTAGPYRVMSAKNGGPLTGCPAKSSRTRGGRSTVRR
jgi:hypothetical protein